MAEEEVNYASVVLKATTRSPPEARKEEETVYDEVKVRSETTEQTADTNDKKANNRRRHSQLLACCFVILCAILLLGIVGVCMYFLSIKQDELRENQKTLLAVRWNLTILNHTLGSENENLRRDHDNLTVQFDNLARSYAALESKITNLTAENQQLETQNQQLGAQRNNLTAKIQDMETQWNELNISRAQWSIDAYCPPKHEVGQCNPCRAGWTPSGSSCYAINNAESDHQKTWDEAQTNCKEKISDLVVVTAEAEKEFISDNSWGSKGYWIGLRVEDGKWKWVDGSDLSENSWIKPPTDGHCAISVENTGLKSVNCGDKKQWICEQKALSV